MSPLLIAGYVVAGIVGLYGIIVLFSVLYIVPQRRVALITQFGRHVKTVKNPGLKLKKPWPFQEVATKVSTAQQQVSEQLQTKTSDDLFVKLPIAIHYYVSDAPVYWFDNDEPVSLMNKVVAASVRKYTAKKTFQDLYNERQEIKESVMSEVQAQVLTYGLTINDIVIDEPQAERSVQESYDNVRESELATQAAKYEAQANYIKMVKAAEADKERNILIGEGVAGFREKVMSNYPEIRQRLIKEGVKAEVADDFMLQAMYLDTLRDAAEKGNMVIVTNGRLDSGSEIVDQLKNHKIGQEVESKNKGKANKGKGNKNQQQQQQK